MRTNPLFLKLRAFADFTEDDERRLAGLCSDVRAHRAKTDLIKEGDRPEAVFLLLEGWACRYKLLHDGSRQIMAYLLPGDLCDVHIFILKQMDHSIGLLSNAKVAAIPKRDIIDLVNECPRIARALWWATLVDEGTLREWIVNLGQRDAFQRLAHLFAELWLRLDVVGLAQGGTFDIPVTQVDLGDTVGLTSVHVNRMLQQMRSDGLVEIQRGHLRVPDVPRLMKVSDFNPNYLHLSRRDG